MALSPQDKSVLTQYTTVAKKIIYDAGRMKTFIKMMATPQGAVQAVETVTGAIEQRKQIPAQIAPLLAVNCYMIMLDVAQAATGAQVDPKMVEQVIGQIMQNAQRGAKPAAAPTQPQGMLAKMQQGVGPEQEPEPAGEGPGPDNTMQHEGAEPAATEQAEGAEEDGPEGEEDGMLARMQRRRVMA